MKQQTHLEPARHTQAAAASSRRHSRRGRAAARCCSLVALHYRHVQPIRGV